MTQLRKPAIWCPWAEVICYSCHGDSFNCYGETKVMSAPDYAEHCALQPKRKGQDEGWCDRCGCDVWAPEELALLQRIRNKVGGHLDQTGGMSAALMISDNLYGSAPQVCVTALDGPLVVGLYPNGQALADGECSEWSQFGDGFVDPTPEQEEEAIAYIKAFTEA